MSAASKPKQSSTVVTATTTVTTSTNPATATAQPQPQPQGTHPTRVSGYGSHSGKHPPATLQATVRALSFAAEKNTDRSRTSLWIGQHALQNATSTNTYTNSSSLSLYSRTHNCTLRLDVAVDGSLIVRNDTQTETTTGNTTTTTHDHDAHDDTATEETQIVTSWIPVEGLYGIYSIPSGKLAIWIQDSCSVYDAPVVNGNSWWHIRKVAQLHVTRIENHLNRPLTRSQRQEEKRQIALLRQALKHHEWYYTSSTPSDSIIPDMTHTLQRAMAWRAAISTSTANNHTTMISNRWNETATASNEEDNSTSAGTATSQTARVLRPDSRFFWNEGLLQDIDTSSDSSDSNSSTTTASRVLLDHVIPVTSAFCGVQTNLIATASTTTSCDDAISYDELLITRRSRFRAGTRFTKRGADHSGDVANYAETEQIVLVHTNNNNQNNRTLSSVMSHVQTRGSIPLRWSSPTDIKTYRPRVRIGTDPLSQARALRQHIADQAAHYIPPSQVKNNRKHAALVFLNLVDKHSDQGRLGRALDAVLTAVLDVYKEHPDPEMPWLKADSIQHIWFDFHAELKHGRWDKLGNLLDQLKPTLMEQGYFRCVPVCGTNTNSTATTTDFQIAKIQTGVTRTNCMDCLDRTNVVQSIFGRFMLFNQLSDDKSTRLSLASKTAFRKKPMSIPWKAGEVAHRMLWADNADAISRLYAGTPALKGDFTRTGKRTKKGALDDGMNSLQRYYLNNFLDADRQEGMDLLVGHQAFGVFGDDDDDESMQDPQSLGGSSRRAMTIQEAARQMLLGNWPVNEQSEDDSDHVRIKVKTNKDGKLSKLPVGGSSSGDRPLDLRWLPGDLQTQVRSLASTSLNELPHEFSSRTALWAIDQRSASDLPWWVVSDSGSDSEDADSISSVVADVGSAATNNAGYLLGAMVAGAQAPIAMSVVVLGLASLVAFPERKEDER